MKQILLVIMALAAVATLCILLPHCSKSAAGIDDFCNSDSDCKDSLVCENNICVTDSGNDECNPACTEESETCFKGQCVPFGNPDDKDGDGSLVGEDCDDFNREILPGAHEYCDGMDNNCDGLTDEGCPDCEDGGVQACSSDIGECVAGLQNCTDGGWEICPGTGPLPELCDSKDNDCDGLTDEVCPCEDGHEFFCGIDEGICAVGVQSCVEGLWSGCHNGELPRTEICNGLDDDCDGLTDENLEANDPPDSCDQARELVGLPDNVVGGSRTTVVGNLWPPGDEDWYKVTAFDDEVEDLFDNCDSFHFALRFDLNPAGLLLDVYVDNCENLDCPGDDSYNFFYDDFIENPNPGEPPIGQCECRGQGPESGEEGFNFCTNETRTFYVRVHAGEDQTETCKGYQLTFSNGIPVAAP